MEIRRAQRADEDTVLGLVAAFREASADAFDEPNVRAGLAPLLDGDRIGVVWLAIDGDRAAGYAVVTWGWSLEVGGLDVVLDEVFVVDRGRGTGSALLERVEADCHERGVRRIVLETERANDAARRLYERHGYVADTSIWMAKPL